MPRVFVTGLGLVSPLGVSPAAAWPALLSGATAVAPYAHHPSIPVHLAARVPRGPSLPASRPASNAVDAIDLTVFPRHAARAALRDAAVRSHAPFSGRAGVALGVCIPHLPDAAAIHNLLADARFRRVSPYWVTRVLPSTPAATVSIAHSLTGPLYTPATACAAAGSALHDALNALRRGDAPAMLSGAADASLHPLVCAAFARAGALAPGHSQQQPHASRPLTPGPFDRARQGFVLAEGAALILLESEQSVRERGAPVYAELAAAAVSADAFAVTAPAPGGLGAERVMRAALSDAGVVPRDVDYINAHATATPAGDAAERAAIARVFANCDDTLVSSTKGATGHLLAAAGAVEAVFTILAISEGAIPPTVGLKSLDDKQVGGGWDDVQKFVPGTPRRKRVRVAMNNSLGFGGINTCVVFKEPPPGFKRKRLATINDTHDATAT